MSKTLLPAGCAGSVCNIEEAMTVLPYALLALGQILRQSFPLLFAAVHSSTRVALVCLVWGLAFHDKRPNPSSIAQRLGTISHDRLQRLRREQVGLSSMVLMLSLVQHCLELMTASPACATALLLDDVFIPKPFARCIEGCYWDYDTAKRQHGFGLRLVVLFWSNGLIEIPIAFLVWHKRPHPKTPASKAPIRLRSSSWSKVQGESPVDIPPMPSFAPRLYRTKNQLARILVWWTHRKGVRADVLLFDSWYANRDNFLLFDRLSLSWVTALPCNRHVRFPLAAPSKDALAQEVLSQEVLYEELECQQWAARYPKRAHYTPYKALQLRAKGFHVRLTGLHAPYFLVIIKDYLKSRSFQAEAEALRERHRCVCTCSRCSSRGRVSTDRNKYLLTNRLDVTVSWVIRSYQRRWAVECSFRALKQSVALEAFQARKFSSVSQHLALCLVGFVCLQTLLQQWRIQQPAQVTEGLTLGEIRRQLQQAYLIMSGDQNHWVHLSSDAACVDEGLRALLNQVSGETAAASSEPNHDRLEWEMAIQEPLSLLTLLDDA